MEKLKRKADLSSVEEQLRQIADNFENWSKKERAKFVYPNSFNLAKVEDWVNNWLLKQRSVAVFFSHPHLCYDKDDFALFLTTERKEFHLIIDFFRLHMPAIATSLKELYDEFWEDVEYHIKCHINSKEIQLKERRGNVLPSDLIGERALDVSWQPIFFLDGAVATLIRRLRHIVKITRENIAEDETKPKGNGGKKKTKRQKVKTRQDLLKEVLEKRPDIDNDIPALANCPENKKYKDYFKKHFPRTKKIKQTESERFKQTIRNDCNAIKKVN